VLELEDGTYARLHVEGDNPFENSTLRALQGRRVRVSGTWRNGVVQSPPGGITEFAEQIGPDAAGESGTMGSVEAAGQVESAGWGDRTEEGA